MLRMSWGRTLVCAVLGFLFTNIVEAPLERDAKRQELSPKSPDGADGCCQLGGSSQAGSNGNLALRLNFRQRAECDGQELQELAGSISRMALSDVRSDGARRPANLGRQSEALVRGEIAGDSIHVGRKVDRALPHLKVAKARNVHRQVAQRNLQEQGTGERWQGPSNGAWAGPNVALPCRRTCPPPPFIPVIARLVPPEKKVPDPLR